MTMFSVCVLGLYSYYITVVTVLQYLVTVHITVVIVVFVS